jgi:hypothetical protein
VYFFRINQFPVKSDLKLPCDPRCCANAIGQVDEPIFVLYRPRSLNEFRQVHYVARWKSGRLRSYDVGNGILVCAMKYLKARIDKEGSTIVVDVDTDHLAHASLWTINLAMAICTLLRGDLALHAASAEVDGSLIGILADSGTGKSTFLWTLMEEGGRFASDDVIPIRMIGGQAIAMPSVSLYPKLHKATLEHYAIDWRQYQKALPDGEEYLVPIAPERRVREPRPLSALFVLKPSSRPELSRQVLVRRRVGTSAISLLLSNMQGLWAVHGQLDEQMFFAQCAALAQSVPIYTVEYCKCFAALPEIVGLIRELVHTPAADAAVLFRSLPHDA